MISVQRKEKDNHATFNSKVRHSMYSSEHTKKKRYHAKGKKTMYYYNIAIFRIMPLYNSTASCNCCLIKIYDQYQINCVECDFEKIQR